MTVQRGGEWGRRVPRPSRLRVVEDDHDLARSLTDGSRIPTAVRGGDMFRTLGGSPTPDGEDPLEASVDLIDLRLDGEPVGCCVAHVLVGAERRRGGLLRGPVVMVMNAQFMGRWNVAPRGHPNDGRVEVVECGPELGLRQRLQAHRRLASGTHVPHPAISSRPVDRAAWSFDRPVVVRADGRPLGRARDVEVAVLADAGTLYV